MSEEELNFRVEKLKEVNIAIDFYESQVERLKKDLETEATFKKDKRYVNYMAVLTNLENNINNYKNQKFGILQEIREENVRRGVEKPTKIIEEGSKDE